MDSTTSAVAHLYRRAGFGATPAHLQASAGRSFEATVEDLVAGLRRPDPAGDAVALPALTPPDRLTPTTDPAAALAARKQRQAQQRLELDGLQTWWLDRMIATATPLREKLVLLWSGHFATGYQKVQDAAFMYRQNQLLRTAGGGAFDALTLAVAKDPAMQIWLDTVTDVVGEPNENFARELMELFTLGIGNYTEDDVKEAARCFTGWAFTRPAGDFVLRAKLHDAGSKTVLGHTGDLGGEDVVAIVTHQPASQRFIVASLWSHLAYPVPPTDPVVDDLLPAYSPALDITALVRAIFLHPAFVSPTARAGLVKQPIEYVVGTARAFGLHAAGGPATAGHARAPSLVAAARMLAQEPFNPPNVGGWPQNGYWLTTASAQLRLQFGVQVAAAADLSWLSGLAPAARVDALADRLAIDGWGPTSRAALGNAAGDPAALVALGLSAPEYVLN